MQDDPPDGPIRPAPGTVRPPRTHPFARLIEAARAREDAQTARRAELWTAWEPYQATYDRLAAAIASAKRPVDHGGHLVSVPDPNVLAGDLERTARRRFEAGPDGGSAPPFAAAALDALAADIGAGRRTIPDPSLGLTVDPYQRCRFCGEDILFTLGADGFRAVPEACTLESGPLVVELAIPSGTLAIGTDFRHHFPAESFTAFFRDEDLRHTRQATERLAADGWVLAIVGEDHAHGFRCGPNAFAFGSSGAGDEPLHEMDGHAGGWLAFADGDRIPAGERVARIPVPPGTYVFTLRCLDRDRRDEDAPGTSAIEITRRSP